MFHIRERMKMKRILSVGVMAIVVAVAASAQVSMGWGVHGNAAQLDVKGTLNSVYGWGYGGGAHLDVNLLMISFRFSGDYTVFTPDQVKYRDELARLLGNAATGYSIDGGNVNILSANANVKWALLPLPIVSPYLTGGIGLVRMSAGDLTVKYQGATVGGFPKAPAETKTAFNIGAGVDLKLAGIALFIEGKYAWILTEGESTGYIPISVGITL
jgi:opacity protein-like surface antigen